MKLPSTAQLDTLTQAQSILEFRRKAGTNTRLGSNPLSSSFTQLPLGFRFLLSTGWAITDLYGEWLTAEPPPERVQRRRGTAGGHEGWGI